MNPLYANMSPALRESFEKWDNALDEWKRCIDRRVRVGRWAVGFSIAAVVLYAISLVARVLAH